MPEPFDDLPPYDPLEHADIKRKRDLEDGVPNVWRFVERVANTPENTLEGFLEDFTAIRDEARRLLEKRR